MEFRLFYRGELKANGNLKHKQELRRKFHIQLKELWRQPPLDHFTHFLNPDGLNILSSVGNFQFAPLVSERLYLIAELDIILLRPEPPGRLVTQSGDIDNRLKTLLDALRMPKTESEFPAGDSPNEDETPFFCLLEDDNLITGLSVTTDRLLDTCQSSSEVILIIYVRVKATRALIATAGLA